MAKTKADAVTQAKATPKRTAAKAKTTVKPKARKAPKAKVEKVTPNPYDLPPDPDQSSLNKFWPSTMRTSGIQPDAATSDVATSSLGVSVQDGCPVESSAGAQPTADSVGGAEPGMEPVATQQLDKNLGDTYEKGTLPAKDVQVPHSVVDQDDGNDNDNEHAVAGLNDNTGSAGNDVSPAIRSARDEIPLREDAMGMTNEKEDSSVSIASTVDYESPSFVEAFMTKGSINLSRGKHISLSEVAQFFRGYEINTCISDWKHAVKVLVSKILTAEEVTLLVEQGRNHPQISDHEIELKGSAGGNHELCGADEGWAFGADPDSAFEDLEELILWLVPSENNTIRLVSDCSFVSALRNEKQMKEP